MTHMTKEKSLFEFLSKNGEMIEILHNGSDDYNYPYTLFNHHESKSWFNQTPYDVIKFLVLQLDGNIKDNSINTENALFKRERARNERSAEHQKSLGDILGDALAERTDQNMITIPATLLTDIMNQQQKLTDVTTEHNANALIAKLYECVASHYEHGDRQGAEAILNAIQYAQQNS